LRAIVTTREVGSDGRGLPQRAFGCADERQLADVKSQRPDTPMLVSRAVRKHSREWWPTSPAHQGDCV